MTNGRWPAAAPWLLAAAICLCTAAPAAAVDLLPNLRPYPASQVRVTYENGRKLLRFTTSSWNNGKGTLEVRGGETSGNRQRVYQRIYDSGGAYREREAGWFTYHAAHRHIHFNGYARYVLKPITVAGAERETQKTSFCLMDSRKINGGLPGAPGRARFRTCNSRVQGISVGWADIYGYRLPGQSFDITGAPFGDYEIRIIVDPQNRLAESNEGDNTSVVRVRISSGGARVVSSTS